MAEARETRLLDGEHPPRATCGKVLIEVKELLKLAVPMFIGGVSWVAMKTTDTSLLGHSGTKYLTASSMSDLWTSSTGVFIQSRVIGTLCGQAYGAGNKALVGIWLQVALVILGIVCIPVAIAWAFTEDVLKLAGKGGELASDAGYFATVLMLCLPLRVVFSQLSTFFAAQKIMRPQVVCAPIAMMTNLALGLVLVLGIPRISFWVIHFQGWSGYGFYACPWVTTGVEYGQAFLVWYIFCWRQGLHRECWPGWSWSHITRERVWRFLEQYVPSSLSIGEAFWRVAVIGAIAATLDDKYVGVWNASYRICWITLTFLGSVAGAMGVKLGMAFGSGDVAQAKFVSMVGVVFSAALLLLVAAVVVLVPRQLGSLFSNDPEILDIFEETRWPLAGFVATMNFAVAIERILTTAGRARTVLVAGLIGSWAGQVPFAYVLTKYWQHNLTGMYTGVSIGYSILIVGYMFSILTLDWHEVVREARIRSEVPPVPAQDGDEEAAKSAAMSLQPVPETSSPSDSGEKSEK